MSCAVSGLSANFSSDYCVDKPIAGVLRIKLVNYDDIDRSATTFDAGKVTITNLALEVAATAYTVDRFKKSVNAFWQAVKKDDSLDVCIHRVNFTVFELNTAAKTNLNNLLTGSRLVAIVENKFGGADDEVKYEIYGYDQGLEITGNTQRSLNDKNGITDVELESAADEEEVKIPYTFFDTDYATTLAAFEAL